MAGKRTDDMDFGREVAAILPAMMREASKNHHILSGKGNLSVAGVLIIDILREQGECRMNEIAKTLDVSMSTATGMVDKLIAENIVKRERSDKDRRVVTVSLLGKGKVFAEKLVGIRVDMISRMYSVLTGKEKKEYLRILRKVYDSLDK